jgi:hypothetical protein
MMTYHLPSLDDYFNKGPKSTDVAFPPACLRTHWDPTMVVKHVLPDFQAETGALDPRPAAKVCFAYHHTSAGDAPLPPEPRSTLPPTPPQFLGGPKRPHVSPSGPPVFPPGGAAKRGFPYRGFNANVESDLLRINEVLTKCPEKRYIPPHGIPATHDFTNSVEDSQPPAAPNVLGGPHAGCREADDKAAWARSDRLFFNPTKYDRTSMVPHGSEPPLRMAASRNALPFPN